MTDPDDDDVAPDVAAVATTIAELARAALDRPQARRLLRYDLLEHGRVRVTDEAGTTLWTVTVRAGEPEEAAQ